MYPHLAVGVAANAECIYRLSYPCFSFKQTGDIIKVVKNLFKIVKEFLRPSAALEVPVEAVAQNSIGESKLAEACPYCESKNFVKRGTRKNKHQIVQLYLCRNLECGKTFTAQDVKCKHFPLNIVIESMSYYNL